MSLKYDLLDLAHFWHPQTAAKHQTCAHTEALIALWPRDSAFPPLCSQSKRFFSLSHKNQGNEEERLFLSYTPSADTQTRWNPACLNPFRFTSACVSSHTHRYPSTHLLIAGECWVYTQRICGFVWASGWAHSAEHGGHWPLHSRAL